MNEARREAAEELRRLLAEFEAGAEPVSAFAQGHGIQSRVFRFSFGDESLSIDCDIPLQPLLSGEETREESNRRVAAAVRVCILLLSLAGERTETDSGSGGPALGSATFSCDARALDFRFSDGEGETIHSGNDWESLAAALSSLDDPSRQDLQILWP